MHLLLPPSEAKATGGRGRPLRSRHGQHTRPNIAQPLAAARDLTCRALHELVGDGRPAAHAADALALPPGVAARALRADAEVLDSATTPALRRYTGTVYTGLAYPTLDAFARRTADGSILVFSGLFGVVRGDERIPDYRVPAKAVLPGLGVAAAFWRPVLTEVLPTTLRRGLVVDLRSSDYAAMWRPPAAMRERVVTVRVLSPVPRGGHAVISYASKLAKGRLARALVLRAAGGQRVVGIDDVTAAWATVGGTDANPSGTGVDLYTS